MKRLINILFLITVTLAISAQNRAIKYYLPRVQTDSIKVVTSFILQGDTFKLTSPINGQILQRDSGIWKNMNNAASVFDSITWNPSTGNLSVWKSGSAFNYANLDGRYALNDTTLGDMTRAVYDTANVTEQLVGISAAQILSNKTLILPIIANYTNAQHDHSTDAKGGAINSDNITEGTTNLFSLWNYVGGGNIRYMDGDVGLGGSPTNLLDVFGTARVEILDVSSSFRMDGLTLTDIHTGASDNADLVTKGYVDDAISAAGGYTDEQAQDAVGAMADTSSVSDVKFNYADGTPLLSATVKDDSHNHTGTTISGLAVADFTSPNVSNWTNDANYITLSQAMGGDLTGTVNNAQVTNDSHNHTTATLPDIVSSIDGVTNDGGNIDLVASGAITLTPNDGANTITIGSTDSQNLSKSKAGNNVTVNISGGTGTTFSVADADSSITNEIQVLTLTNDTLHLSKSGGDIKLPVGADNWGTQYVKLNSDSLLKGRGTTATPLRIDTTKVATQYDISGFLSAEVDGSVTNEAQTFASGFSTWPYLYVTQAGSAGGGTVWIKGRGINTATQSNDTIIITGTEVDGSITNEIELPTQSGNSGKFLTTNGTSPSWATALTAEVDGSITNEIQNLTYNASTRIMNISSGTGDTIPTFSTTSGTAGLTPGSNSGGSSVFLNGSGAWSVPSGAGNVSKVGTPVDNQVGVWTGDGTIEGDADLVFNGTKLTTTQLFVSSPTAGTSDYDKFLVLDVSGTEVKYRTGAEILSDIGAQGVLTTGNLTESVTGLQFDATRQVIGGAAALSLSSGYVIPTTTEQTNWGTAYTHSTNDADLSATNEIELPTQSGNSGKFLTTNGTIPSWATALTTEVDGSTTNEIQNLSKSKAGNNVTINISGGTGTTFSVADADSSITNEIELPSQTGNSGKFLTTNGTIPSWASFTGDNWGTQYVVNNSDSLLKGRGTTASPLKIDTTKVATQYDIRNFISSEVDASTTNELNTSVLFNNSNRIFSITDAGGAKGDTIPLFSTTDTNAGLVSGGSGISAKFLRGDNTWQTVVTSEGDASATNELQNLSYTQSTGAVGISDGTGFILQTFGTTNTYPGLVTGSNGNTTRFLRGDNTWQTALTAEVDGSTTNELQNLGYTASTRELTISSGTGVTLPTFSTSNANSGLVPGSSGAGATVFLNGNGGWTTPSGNDNWGTQYVITDNTLTGQGTSGSTLKVDTSKIATQYDLVASGASGWVDGGTSVNLATSSDYVGIGTTGSSMYKVKIMADASDGLYVVGQESGSYRNGIGIISLGTGAKGMYSRVWGTGNTVGIQSNVTSSTAIGIYTNNTTSSGSSLGILSESYSPDAIAGKFMNSASSGNAYGLYASTGSSSGYAGYFSGNVQSNSNILSSAGHVGTNGSYPLQLTDDGYVYFSQITAPSAPVSGTGYLYVAGTSGSEKIYFKNNGATYDLTSGGTGMTNPMTTTGDIIYSSSGTTPARLGIGSTGQVLTVSGGIPSWQTLAGGGNMSTSTYDSNSDGVFTVPNGGTGLSSLTAYALMAGGTTSTGNMQQVSGLGTSGQVLTSNGASALPSWQSFSASPAGSGTEIQYKNGTAFGAISGTSVSGSDVSFTGNVLSSAGSIGCNGSNPIGLTTSGYAYLPNISAPSAPTSGMGYLYIAGTTGSEHIYFKNQNQSAYDLTAGTGGGGDMYKSTYDNSGTADIIDVENGGTGLSSLTTYALLTGGTTSTGNLQQVSGTGTTGQVLTSQGAGSLPAWGNVVDNSTTNELNTSFSYTDATRKLNITDAGASRDVTLPLFNTGSTVAGLVPGSDGIGSSFFLNAEGGWSLVDQSTTNEIELPSQYGNSGKYLYTDGTYASWMSVSASPAGSGSEIQYRNGTAFGAISGSSVSSNNISFTGTVTASNFILSSDQRLKENIKPLSDLKWVDDIPIRTFNMKGERVTRYGVIAQEVLMVAPELVRKNQDGIYSVAYTDFLIAKVARQDEKIKSLEERIERLEKLIK